MTRYPKKWVEAVRNGPTHSFAPELAFDILQQLKEAGAGVDGMSDAIVESCRQARREELDRMAKLEEENTNLRSEILELRKLLAYVVAIAEQNTPGLEFPAAKHLLELE